MPILNNSHSSPRPEIELAPRANSFTDVELGQTTPSRASSFASGHTALAPRAAADAVEQPDESKRRRRRYLLAAGIGTLLATGVAGGVAGAIAATRRHPKPALHPPVPAPRGPAPAPEPSLAPVPATASPVVAPVPSPEPTPSPSPSPVPTLAPSPSPVPTLSPPTTPAPAPTLTPFVPGGAYQLTPYAQPQSSGQITAGEYMTLVVSTNGNACGETRRDPTHTLVLQLARPQMATLTPGAYAGVGNVTAPEQMANVTSAPASLTGFAGVESAFGSGTLNSTGLQVSLTGVSHSGGNFTGSFSLTVNDQRLHGDFNAASCANLFGNV